MIILREVPTVADQRPKIKYSVPISLWFVEKIIAEGWLFNRRYIVDLLIT